MILVVTVVLLPLLMVERSVDSFVPLRMLALSVLVFGAFAFLREKLILENSVSGQWPFRIWLLFLAWGLMVSGFAMVPRDAFFEIARLVVFTGLWLVLSWSLNQLKNPARTVGLAASSALVLVAGIGLGQYFGYFRDLPGFAGFPSGTMGNSNFLGAAVQFLLPGTLLALREKGMPAIMGALGLAIGLGGLWVAHSTGAWLGMVAGMVVTVIYLLPLLLKKAIRWGFALRTTVVALGFFVGIALFAFWSLDMLGTQPDVKMNTTQDSGIERLIMWKHSFAIVSQKPILGCGPDNWNYAVLENGLVGQGQGYATRYTMHAHNDFLEVFASYGVIGGLGFLLFLCFAWWQGWRRQLQDESQEAHWFSGVAVGGLTGWMVNAGLSFPFHRPYLLAMLLLWIAVIGRGTINKVTLPQWSTKGMVFVLMGTAGAMTIWSGLRLHGYGKNFQLLAAKEAQDWRAVIALTDKAQSWYNYDDGISKSPLHWYKGNALLSLGRNQEALVSLEQAHRQNPWHPMVASNYAVALVMNGQTNEAISELERLISMFPEFDDARINLVRLYIVTQAWQKAEAAMVHWNGMDFNQTINQLRNEILAHNAQSAPHSIQNQP
ncbi:MAG: hypothetical protein RLZZ519_911 [Bacteroidota bacterium]